MKNIAKKVKMQNRSAERELAFRSIFQLSFHKEAETAAEGINHFLDSETETKTEDSLDIDPGDFTRALISAVMEQQQHVDDVIAKYIREGWTMERLPNVEKAILRLCTAEMLYLGTPKEIAINEAVNLVKIYGDDDAFRYVNGILHHIADDCLKKEEEHDVCLSGN